MPIPTNQQVIDEFRAHGGAVGGPFAGAPLLLLTTTGARTGLARTSPTTYLREGGRLHVFASNAGAGHHPAWFHNLRAHRRATVEIGRDGGVARYAADATVLTGAERERIYARQAELVPVFAGYQAATSRMIPVIALDAVAIDGNTPSARPGTSAPGTRQEEAAGRAVGGSAQLRAVHDGLRADLAALRARLADGAPGTALPPSLLEHCVAFCGAVSAHHDRESSAFPELERRFPVLGPGLRRIRAEHVVVAGLVTQLRETLGSEQDRTTLQTRVELITRELEAHFAYEEAQLAPALDAA